MISGFWGADYNRFSPPEMVKGEKIACRRGLDHRHRGQVAGRSSECVTGTADAGSIARRNRRFNLCQPIPSPFASFPAKNGSRPTLGSRSVCRSTQPVCRKSLLQKKIGLLSDLEPRHTC